MYNSSLFYIQYILWIFTVILYAIKAPESYYIIIGVLAIILSFIVVTKNNLYGLYVLPLIALIGPILSIKFPGFGMLTFADIYVLFIFCYFLALSFIKYKFIIIGNYWRIYLCLTVLLTASWLFSIDIKYSSIAMLNIMQLFAIYLITLNLVISKKDVKNILFSWVFACIICNILILYKYYINEPMLMGYEDIYSSLYVSEMKDSIMSFYRATYFYAGFPFILTITTVLIIIDVSFIRYDYIIYKIGLFIMLIINLITIFFMSNKSSLISLFIISLIIYLIWSGVIGKIKRFSFLKIIFGSLIFSIMCAIIYSVVINITTLEQQVAVLERLKSQDSLYQRIEIYKNAFQYLYDNPKALIIGIGSDIIVRVGEHNEDVAKILFNQWTGFGEGAIDSSYISIMVENGVLVLMLLLYSIYRILKHLQYEFSKHNDIMCMSIYLAILSWMIMGITKLTGTSKITWLIVQLIAVGEIITSNRFQKKI